MLRLLLLSLLLLPLNVLAEPLKVQIEQNQGPATSGVIIDARGLKFAPSMGMRLFNNEWEQIYTTPQMNKNLDVDAVVALGTALYAPTLDRAKSLVYRIGTNPLLIQALSIRGGDLVLTDADARELLRLNDRDHFLDRFSVVVIWDRPANFDESPIKARLSPRGVPEPKPLPPANP